MPSESQPQKLSTRARRRRWAALGLIPLAFAALAAGNLLLGGNYHPVVEGEIYRSAQPSANMLRQWEEDDGIRTVVNLRGRWDNDTWYQVETSAAEELGLCHYDVNMFTHRLAPLPELRKLVEIYDTCPKPVLVHCRRGSDRTALASAIYLLLYENCSLDEAVSMYHLRYGHSYWARGFHLPHLFDCYRDWLAEQGSQHTAAEFRRWLSVESTIGYFGAALETECAPIQVGVGEPIELTLKVTNISRYPWELSESIHSGIHFEFRAYAGGDKPVETVYAGGPPGTVEPGEAVFVSATLPGIEATGKVHIYADVLDAYELMFCEMGKGRWEGIVDIVPDPELAHAAPGSPTP